MGICGIPVLMFFYCGDAVIKIYICHVAVISNPSVCDVRVIHVAFGEMKLFAVLGFLVWSFSDLNLACVNFVNFYFTVILNEMSILRTLIT